MSEQIGTQSSTKRHRNRQAKQDGKETIAPHRPTTDDQNEWKEYWKTQLQIWRTEPEIDAERQAFLAECRSTTPDIKHGIYPFKDIKLSRADVEWLLATHESEGICGPVDLSDELQRTRSGLDLRGADLCDVDLHMLPLACLMGGLIGSELIDATEEQCDMAAVHLNGADLSKVQLNEANLCKAQLNRADLSKAQLNGAYLSKAQLNEAYLIKAQLNGADLSKAQLNGAHLIEAQLQKTDLNKAILKRANLIETQLEEVDLSNAQLVEADLSRARLNRAYLRKAFLKEANLTEAQLIRADLCGSNLERAHLIDTQLEATDLRGAHLNGADLRGAHLNGTNLRDVILADEMQIGPRLADVQWDGCNLTVVKWSQIEIIGDEHGARQKRHEGKVKEKVIQLDEFEAAVRANRQLAVVLQAQGLNEHASRFAYCAQNLQRIVFWQQRKFGQYLFSLFLSLISGYGYRLWRSFATYAVVIVSFAIAFYLLGPTAKLAFSPLDAVVFSLISFHGRGFSPGENIGLSNPLTILAAIEAFVGLIIEVTLIATLTQRFFGK